MLPDDSANNNKPTAFATIVELLSFQWLFLPLYEAVVRPCIAFYEAYRQVKETLARLSFLDVLFAPVTAPLEVVAKAINGIKTILTLPKRAINYVITGLTHGINRTAHFIKEAGNNLVNRCKSFFSKFTSFFSRPRKKPVDVRSQDIIELTTFHTLDQPNSQADHSLRHHDDAAMDQAQPNAETTVVSPSPIEKNAKELADSPIQLSILSENNSEKDDASNYDTASEGSEIDDVLDAEDSIVSEEDIFYDAEDSVANISFYPTINRQQLKTLIGHFGLFLGEKLTQHYLNQKDCNNDTIAPPEPR